MVFWSESIFLKKSLKNLDKRMRCKSRLTTCDLHWLYWKKSCNFFCHTNNFICMFFEMRGNAKRIWKRGEPVFKTNVAKKIFALKINFLTAIELRYRGPTSDFVGGYLLLVIDLVARWRFWCLLLNFVVNAEFCCLLSFFVIAELRCHCWALLSLLILFVIWCWAKYKNWYFEFDS